MLELSAAAAAREMKTEEKRENKKIKKNEKEKRKKSNALPLDHPLPLRVADRMMLPICSR